MIKMKGYKGFYDEKFFNEIIEKSKSLGLITETFKQLESYEKNPDNLNKDSPFNGNDK